MAEETPQLNKPSQEELPQFESNLDSYIKNQDGPDYRKKVLERARELFNSLENASRGEMPSDFESRVASGIVIAPEKLRLLEMPGGGNRKYFEPYFCVANNVEIFMLLDELESVEVAHRKLLETLKGKEIFGRDGECTSPRSADAYSKNTLTSHIRYQGDPTDPEIRHNVTLKEVREEVARNIANSVMKRDCPVDLHGRQLRFSLYSWSDNGKDLWQDYKPLLQALQKSGYSFVMYGMGDAKTKGSVQAYNMRKE